MILDIEVDQDIKMPPKKAAAAKEKEPKKNSPKSRAPRAKKQPRKEDNSDDEETSMTDEKRAKLKKIQMLKMTCKIFTEAQSAHNVNSCIERMLKFFREVDYELVYYALRECTLYALMNTPEDAPHKKYVFGFLTRLLVRRCQIELEEDGGTEVPEEEEESDSDQEVSEESDHDDLLADEPSSGRSKGKKAVKKPKAKKKEKKPVLRLTIVDRIIQEVFIQALEADSVTTRVNCCCMSANILEEINDIMGSIYDQLRKALIDCLANKSAVVRAEAVRSLLRFQEITTVNDVVTAAFKFHLNSDPDPKVRQAILCVIEPSKTTLDTIITKTRDVKDFVRKAAYMKICDRVHVKTLTFEQRLSILREGLHDRSPAVRTTVQKKLIVQWLRCCNDDVIELLEIMDIESDIPTIEAMLTIMFKMYMNQKNGDKSKFHAFVENFKNTFLDARKLLLKKPLTVENTYLWFTLAKFCKENNINQLISKDASDLAQVSNEVDTNFEKEIDELFANIQLSALVPAGESQNMDASVKDTEEEDADTTLTGPTPPKKSKTTIDTEVDLLDVILPQAPHLCYFLKRFAQTVEKTEFDDLQLSDYEFVYDHLVKILGLVEIRDSCQKSILVNTVKEIFNLENLPSKLTNVCPPLMSLLAKNVFHTSDELLKFTQDIIQDIYNKIFEDDEESEQSMSVDDDNDAFVAERQEKKKEPKTPRKEYTKSEVRQIEIKYAEITIKLEEVNDELDLNVKNQNYLAAEELKSKKHLLEKERDALKRERLIARGEVVDSEDEDDEEAEVQRRGQRRSSTTEGHSQSNIADKQEVKLDQHPKELMKCLLIFTACLEAGSFTELNTVIQTNLEKICFAGILSANADVRSIAVKAVGMVCFTHISIARRYLTLIAQVVLHDEVKVRNHALRGVFDIICEFGLQELKGSDKPDRTSNNTTIEGTQEINLTEITEGDTMTSHDIEKQRTETPDTFEEDFFKMTVDQLDSLDMSTRLVAVKGVCKMLFLGRISSTVLLSKLLLMWYNQETNQSIMHYLGSWFPIFAFQDNLVRSASSGQLAFEEAFLPTLETAFIMSNKPEEDLESGEFLMSDKQLENLVSFMINLMSESCQVSAALTVSHRFLELVKGNKNDLKNFEDKVLSKALLSLSILTATRRQLKELKVHINLIIKLLPTSFNRKLSKSGTSRVKKVLEKIDNLMEQMPPGDLDSSQVLTPTKGDQSRFSAGDVTVMQLANDLDEEEDEDEGEETDKQVDYSFLSDQGSQRSQE